MSVGKFEKTLEKALEAQSETILEAMDFRFGKVDKRFDKLESKTNGLESKTNGLESKMDKIEGKMDKMEKENLEQHERICKQLTDLQQESKMSFEIYKKHDDLLKEHGERIGSCERELGLAKG